MDAFMLDGWTPIILAGIAVALIMFIASRNVSFKSLFLTTAILSLICIGAILYSIIGLGGWEGMGLGVFTIVILIGIWLGTGIGAISKNKRR